MNQSPAPKVFVSHASEDKERFVLEFARRLRGRGVDAWLDRWEMLPGDRLVDKIFEEGIKHAQAVVVVISKNSVSKRWVREELDAAMVRRINGASKLIPVIIDDCEVPECLQSTVWERIMDLKNFDCSLDRIVLSVFGQHAKPPLGPAPKVVENDPMAIGDLAVIDSTVLGSLCGFCMEENREWIKNASLLKISASLQIDEEPFCDSLEILEGRGYVELKRIGAKNIGMAKPSVLGFDEYLRRTREDYQSLFETVGLRIVNGKKVQGSELAKSTQLPEVIVNHVVRFFEMKGWVKVTRYMGGSPCCFFILGFSPELRRWLQP